MVLVPSSPLPAQWRRKHRSPEVEAEAATASPCMVQASGGSPWRCGEREEANALSSSLVDDMLASLLRARREDILMILWPTPNTVVSFLSFTS